MVIDVIGLNAGIEPNADQCQVRPARAANTSRAVLVCPPVSNVEGGDAPDRCRMEAGLVWTRGEVGRSAQFDLDAVCGEHLQESVESDRWTVSKAVVTGDEVLAGHRRVIPDQSERSRSAPLPE